MTVKLREDIKALQNAVGTGNSSSLATRVSALETSVDTASTGLKAKVTALETTVGGANSGVVKDVNTLKGLIYLDGDDLIINGLKVVVDNSTHAVTMVDPA